MWVYQASERKKLQHDRKAGPVIYKKVIELLLDGMKMLNKRLSCLLMLLDIIVSAIFQEADLCQMQNGWEQSQDVMCC